jgi:hypothetical protein
MGNTQSKPVDAENDLYPCAILIYRIWFPAHQDQGYVGSTAKTLEQRFNQHISDSKRSRRKNIKLYKFIHTLPNGWEDAEIEELQFLENCPSAKARLDEENSFIYWLEATLNQYRPGAWLAFGDQKLYEHNKYKTNEKRRERVAANCKRQQANKFSCDCGGKTDGNSKARHARSKRHRTWLESTGQEQPPPTRKRTKYID